ncbi:MAG: hypothetical protein ACR2JW_16805 [Thermomicrobiales bacterium]
MLASSALHTGQIYTRDDLQKQFDITDMTIRTGIFVPRGYDSIWLFITEKKPNGMTDYRDYLDGNKLDWDGQTSGRKDRLIIEHERNGFEILVFYRTNKLEYNETGHPYGFKLEGQFRYRSSIGSNPTHFVLDRVR